MKLKYADLLALVALFNKLERREIERLLEAEDVRLERFAKGQIVHLQNEQCHHLDIVLEGKALVQRIDLNGNVLQIARFEAGALLGAHLLFSERNSYPWTVTAESRTTVLQVGRDSLLALCQASSTFLAGLMRVISDRVQVLAGTIDVISYKSIREKLLDFIRFEYHLQKANPIRLKVTKKELAEKLGIQRSSLSRELGKMHHDGLLAFDAKSITLLKLSAFD